MSKAVIRSIAIVALIGFSCPQYARAEEKRHDHGWWETRGSQEDTSFDQDLEKMKKLREENPEEFHRIIQQRKARIHREMEELKQKDPQKYEEVKSQMMNRRKQRLEKLRKEDPDKFHQIMQEKKKKLRELKEKDPEQYEKFLKEHPRLAKKIREGKGWGKGSNDQVGREG